MAKTAVIFSTKHGCAKQCATLLREHLRNSADLLQLGKDAIHLANYEHVILGSSIYVGTIQKEMKQFCEENKEQLLRKKLAFYTCGMQEGQSAKEQLAANYPADLLAHAVVSEPFGGRLHMQDMRWWEKLVIRIVMKTTDDQDRVDPAAIKAFAKVWNYS